jgi:O-antigen ligase
VLLSSPEGGWFYLEKKFSLLVFPVLLGFVPLKISKKQFKGILMVFALTTVCAALWTFKDYLFTSLRFDATDIENHIVMHRPYFGIYTLFSVFIILFQIKTVDSLGAKALLSICIAFLLLFTFLILAKMALMSFVITVILLVFIALAVEGKTKRILQFLLVAMICLLVVWIQEDGLGLFVNKLIKRQPFSLADGQWTYFLSFNMRYAIWDCCWSLLSEGNNWIKGIGLNNQQLLDTCYNSSWIRYGVDSQDGIDPLFLTSSFNAHNEFFQIWLDAGIVGLLLILVVFGVSYSTAIQKRDYLHLSFILLFLFCSLSESLLARQKGIVFFALFNSLFSLRDEISN